MYHAHIYFDLPKLALAKQVHQLIASNRSDIRKIFPLVTRRVGPHDKPMFEVHFNDDQNGFINWLDQNRQGLSVLIHPVTGDELSDHTTGTQWLGQALPIHIQAIV